MAGPRVGILVISTGYRYDPGEKPDPLLNVQHHDFVDRQPAFRAADGAVLRAGYTPRPDGSDSVYRGPGTLACRRVLSVLRGRSAAAFPFAYEVVSLKAGDGGDPLRSVTATAVLSALRYVASLGRSHPDWRWVAYLDWDATAYGEVVPVLAALRAGGVPLVLPVGCHNGSGLDLDLLQTPPGSGVLTAASAAGPSDYGAATVTLAVDTPDGTLPGPSAAAWLACAMAALPAADAVRAVEVVKDQVQPSPSWRGRCQTWGSLVGVPP